MKDFYFLTNKVVLGNVTTGIVCQEYENLKVGTHVHIEKVARYFEVTYISEDDFAKANIENWYTKGLYVPGKEMSYVKWIRGNVVVISDGFEHEILRDLGILTILNGEFVYFRQDYAFMKAETLYKFNKKTDKWEYVAHISDIVKYHNETKTDMSYLKYYTLSSETVSSRA